MWLVCPRVAGVKRCIDCPPVIIYGPGETSITLDEPWLCICNLYLLYYYVLIWLVARNIYLYIYLFTYR